MEVPADVLGQSQDDGTLSAQDGKSREIVVCCMGTLSRAFEEAARELTAVGYTNVRGYLEGKQDRIKAGLPYEESQD